jgi:hypothetical protein
MSEPQTSRHRTRRSSRKRGSDVRRGTFLVVAAVAVIVASAVIFLFPSERPRTALLTRFTEPDIPADVVDQVAHDDSAREVYPYSVIPGGVYSSAELADAIEKDAPVAEHYADATPAAMRVEVVDTPREAYMSYRVGDRIFWTKRKLALRKGERVLTDGNVTIRARCGNRLSDNPVLPTSDAEPAAAAFERDPAPPVAAAPPPVLRNSPDAPAGLAAVPPLQPVLQPVSDAERWAGGPFLGGIGPIGGLGGVMPFVTDGAPGNTNGDRGDRPVAYPPPFETSPGGNASNPPGGGPGSPNPPAGGPEPNVPGGGGGGHENAPPVVIDNPPWTPPGNGLPGGPPGGDIPGNPPVVISETPGGTGGEPRPPVVVPEPTSLTLLGTGIAWLTMRRSRARAKSN